MLSRSLWDEEDNPPTRKLRKGNSKLVHTTRQRIRNL